METDRPLIRTARSAIPPGCSKNPLSLSNNISARSLLKYFFGFVRLDVDVENGLDLVFFFEGIVLQRTEIYYEETNHVKDATLIEQIYCVIYIDDWISCDLFPDMLTYKLIQYDRTCQRVINIINIEKTFAPNNFAQKQNFLSTF